MEFGDYSVLYGDNAVDMDWGTPEAEVVFKEIIGVICNDYIVYMDLK